MSVGLALLGSCILIRKFSWALSLTFFLFGLFYALWHCQAHLNSQLTTPHNTEMTIRVDSLPRHSAHKVSFIGSNGKNAKRYLFNWYLKDQSLPTIEPGLIYNVEVRLKPPHGLANGVGFDLEKWLFRQSISGTATIKSMVKSTKQQWSLNGLLNQWRLVISRKINQHFKSPQVNALVHALSIGDKSHFEHQDTEMFQKTGTAHLIAISGLHIGMVALLGWLLGGVIFWLFPSQQFNKQLMQVLCGIVLATFYAGLAGFAISTQRALIMLLVFAVFKLKRKNIYTWDAWALSLIIVLLSDPLSALDTGFWLSFAAVAVLIFTSTGIRTNKHPIFEFLKMQKVLLLGMLPLSLMIFSRVNLMTPLINYLLIPVMTFMLVPLLLLLLVVSLLMTEFPTWLVELISFLAKNFIVVLNWFGQLNTLTYNIFIVHWWQFLLMITGAFILVLPAAVPGRIMGVLFIVLALLNKEQKPPLNNFQAHFLDVGQGLSVVVTTHKHTLVYDVGAAYDSGFNMADAALIPFINHLGIKQLDALVLSHQDNDHSGAAEYLTNHFEVDNLWGTDTDHKPCTIGNQWQWDGVNFEFLSPYNLTPYLHNNSSCVLKISNLNYSLLLTGDIESAVEYRLTQSHTDSIKSDVLLIPHHGSKTSSTQAFIDAVKPKWAINSSAKYNPFNHPADEVVTRYQELGIRIKDTQDDGLLTANTYPELKVQSLRENKPRIWRTKKPE